MPRYRAIQNGHLGHAGYIKKGEVFNYEGKPGSWMELVDDEAVEVKETVSEPDRQQIIAELKTLNIQHFKGAKTDVLQNLLQQTMKAQGKA